MKFDDAVDEEISQLEQVVKTLKQLKHAYEKLPEKSKVKCLNARFAHEKFVIYDESGEYNAFKKEAFRLYDSLGFVKEGLKK